MFIHFLRTPKKFIASKRSSNAINSFFRTSSRLRVPLISPSTESLSGPLATILSTPSRLRISWAILSWTSARPGIKTVSFRLLRSTSSRSFCVIRQPMSWSTDTTFTRSSASIRLIILSINGAAMLLVSMLASDVTSVSISKYLLFFSFEIANGVSFSGSHNGVPVTRRLKSLFT